MTRSPLTLQSIWLPSAIAREGVAALVTSYVDWVVGQPALARFLFQAQAVVAKSPQRGELAQRNRQKHRQVLAWLTEPA